VRLVEPKIRLIARPVIDWGMVKEYLIEVEGMAWFNRVFYEHAEGIAKDGDLLVEFAAKGCYRAWEAGLNPNVTKVREDSPAYIANLLGSGHGSPLAHAQYTFVCQNISRVETHEHVRHAVGVAISQESMRYVRFDDIPFWMPEWAQADEELMVRATAEIKRDEEFQAWLVNHFGLDRKGDEKCQSLDHWGGDLDGDAQWTSNERCENCNGTGVLKAPTFGMKKAKTSFMRRFIPHGVATMMTWSANVRSLRFIIQQRTEFAAEEEIRIVFDQVATIMQKECPLLFGDFTFDYQDADPVPQWVPEHRKV
jgi:thymidylate synthase (FAD)